MISAGTGKDVANAIKQELRDNICGQGWVDSQQAEDKKKFVEDMGVVDATCQDNFDVAWDKNTKGLNETQLEFFAANAAYYVSAQLHDLCQNNPTFGLEMSGDRIPNTIFAKSRCLSNYVNPAQLPFSGEVEGIGATTLPEGPTDLNYHGTQYDFEQLLAHIKLSTIGMHQGASEGIDMPQSLKDFIAELEKAGLPEHAELAHDLFYQGVGLTKPSGEMAVAAQPIADQVQNYVRTKAGKPLQDYVMADDDKPVEKEKIAKDNAAKKFPDLEYTFVSKTGKKPEYKVDIKTAPKAIMDYFKDFTPEVRKEALRLYGEALVKAGKGAKDEDVAKLLVDKIKEMEKKHGGDKTKLADQLTRLKVHKVDMPKKEMLFREIDSSDAPGELYERVGTEGSKVKEWIINDIWKRIRAKLKDQGVEAMDLKLMSKIVDDLAPKLKGMPIKDLAAQEVMAVNKKSGKVTLFQQPKEIQDILFHTANALNSNIPVSRAQMGAMVYQKIETIYRAANNSKDKPKKMKDAELATKVDEAVDKYLDPYVNEWTDDGVEALRTFLGVKFDGFNPDGSIKLKEAVVSGGNGGAFVDGTPEDGLHSVVVTGLADGGVVSADDAQFAGYASVDFLYQYYKAKAGGFRLGIGIDGGGMPGVLLNGEPRGEVNVGDGLSDGQGLFIRFSEISLGYFYDWNKGEDKGGEFAIKGGLIPGRFKDGTGRGLDSLSAPMNSYQFFTAGGSKMYGIAPSLMLNNDIIAWTLTAIGGTANSYFLYDKDGGAIDAKGGRVGASTKLSADWAGGNDKFNELGVDVEVGYQHAFAGVDENAFTVGGSFGLLHDNGLDFGAGVGFGLHGDSTEKDAYRLVLGGHLGYKHALKKNEDVTFLAGLGVSMMRHWQDKRVDEDIPTPDPADCDDGYDCDSDADVGQTGNGLSSTDNLSNFITAGNNVWEFSPYLGFNFKVSEASSIDLTLKVPVWYMDNIQANDVKETNWGVILGFGVNYDSSKLFKK